MKENQQAQLNSSQKEKTALDYGRAYSVSLYIMEQKRKEHHTLFAVTGIGSLIPIPLS
jgi:hypothetical protein